MRSENDAVRKMLALNDKELTETIRSLCAQNGIDVSSLVIGGKEIAILRAVLSNAKDEDIARFMGALRQKNGGKP